MKFPEKPPDFDDMEIFDIVTKGTKRRLDEDARNFNKKYLYWSELKYRIPDEEDRKKIWAIMKFLRSGNYEELKAPIKNLKYSLLSVFNRRLNSFASLLAGDIDSRKELLGLEPRYVVSSLMEEAIASSMIEGAATTRKAGKAMLREKRHPKTDSEKMILNNYQAMQYIREIKKDLLTPEILLEIQRKITKNTLDKPYFEGQFRDNDDIVVGHSVHAERIAHVPPPHKKIPSLIDKLCDFANQDYEEDFIDPIIKGIVLHFLISYIHPFNDGNGRTARSVFYWYMLSQGYWLFEYLPISRRILRSRKGYYLAYLYTKYDEMDLTYFIKYNMDCIDECLDDLRDYTLKKQKEEKGIRKIISENPGINRRQAEILDEFMEDPNKIFTIGEISETYGTVYQTARTDLLLLSEKGFVTKKLSGKKFIFSLNETRSG